MCKSGKVGPFPALVMPFISVLQILGKVKTGDLLTSGDLISDHIST